MAARSISIGRDPGADLRIEGASVSRHHARAEHREDGSIVIRDLESTNGLFLERGGSKFRITEAPLQKGDHVWLGSARIDARDIAALFRQAPEASILSARPMMMNPGTKPPDPSAAPEGEALPPPGLDRKRRGRPRRDPVTNELRYRD
ncbi:MAG: FHA domain-containing protein [Pseudomonadota bacterium]